MVANATRQESEKYWGREEKFADDMAIVPKLPQKINSRTYKISKRVKHNSQIKDKYAAANRFPRYQHILGKNMEYFPLQ